jgi:hypothetical protein
MRATYPSRVMALLWACTSSRRPALLPDRLEIVCTRTRRCTDVVRCGDGVIAGDNGIAIAYERLSGGQHKGSNLGPAD